MTKLIPPLVLLMPGAALAHGGHAPLTGPAHGLFHGAPLAMGIAAIVLAVALGLIWRDRQ